MIMGIVGWIVFGFVVGLLARAILPGRDKMNFFATVILGIIGALAAGFVGRALGFYESGQGAGYIASIIGAIIVLAIYHSAVRHRTTLPGTKTTDKIDRIDRAA